MFDVIDRFLNSITMYRLLLYYLIALIALAVFESFLGVLPFNPFALLFSTLFILGVSLVTNFIFAKVFEAPRNIESVYITSLILALIITPTTALHSIPFLFWAGVLANGSKYIVATAKKHIFNPAAFAVWLTAFALNNSATWWVGTGAMLPLVLAGGFLIVRKINRSDMVWSFFFASLVTILGLSAFKGTDLLNTAQRTFLDSPLLFFAFVMLTEPLTTPPTKKLQVIYGALVGILFAPQFHIGPLFTAPESALLIGNLFSYLVSPKSKPILELKQKAQIGPNLYEFIFAPDRKLNFLPGQYVEWTLEHKKTDSRGNRRYFTIASSPTENEVIAGIKFYENASSFKRALIDLPIGGKIAATSLLGDFTLPEEKTKKLVFIAGGIGVTPFRSMIKYLLDKGEKRDIVLFYSAKTQQEFVFKDIFDRAQKELGIKVIYSPGRLTEETLKQQVPDLKERAFYISGPLNMVTSFKHSLKELGVRENHIITDYFPGFAS